MLRVGTEADAPQRFEAASGPTFSRVCVVCSTGAEAKALATQAGLGPPFPLLSPCAGEAPRPRRQQLTTAAVRS